MMKTLNSPKLPLGEINFNTFKKATSTSKSSNMASQQNQIVKYKNSCFVLHQIIQTGEILINFQKATVYFRPHWYTCSKVDLNAQQMVLS